MALSISTYLNIGNYSENLKKNGKVRLETLPVLNGVERVIAGKIGSIRDRDVFYKSANPLFRWFCGRDSLSAIQTDSPIQVITAFGTRPPVETDSKPVRIQPDHPSPEFYVPACFPGG